MPDEAPAAHSPATTPDAKFELAAVTASRSEQDPSLGSTSSKGVLTSIWLAAAGDASARAARRTGMTAPLVIVMNLLHRGTRIARVVASCACSPRPSFGTIAPRRKGSCADLISAEIASQLPPRTGQGVLRLDREDPPRSGHALELVFPAVAQCLARADDEVADGAADENFAWCG